MEARATLRPGQKGTKKLVTRFGDRLICVRYRYDTTRGKRFTTVELIVDESDWTASIPIAAEAAAPAPTESPTETAAIETPAGAPKEPYGEPSVAKPDLVGLRVGFKEMDLRQKRNVSIGLRHRWSEIKLQSPLASPALWAAPATRWR